MKIKLDELQEIITFLLSYLKESKGIEIELKNDYYWDIPCDQLYNPYESPKDILIGQLSDDLTEIKRLLKAKEEAIPYDLKRVAEILKDLSVA